MRTSLGPVQTKVILLLKGGRGYATTAKLAGNVYGLKEPTRSQLESIRQTLRTLERLDVVRITKYIWEGQRCWELTGKTVPLPGKRKTKPTKPNLSVVSPT